MSFAQLFEKLTGHPPFPWQESLYERFREGVIPTSCNIPTGLGKTNILAIWYIAWVHKLNIPRRLVYIVNRRTVVDQSTYEAIKLRERAQMLGLEAPAISTLRGQFVDNGEWFANPSRPAIICGTVDMIGSRLLFNGYGIGFKSKPLHAGFLAQDALIVHDEAHLEPAFQELLESIYSEQKRHQELLPFHVMELTATSRTGGVGKYFGIQEEDRKHPIVKKRLGAVKRLNLVPVEKTIKPAEKIAEIAASYRHDSVPVLVYSRKLDDVIAIRNKLKKSGRTVLLLTGTMRGKERDELTKKSEFDVFRKNTDAKETVYLVCTSAGEVGIDISAARLVCDLSTFDSMAQRLGRLNRYGEYPESHITVVHPTSFEDDDIERRRSKTLDLLKQLPLHQSGDFDASPSALNTLNPQARIEAYSLKPEIFPASDILFDAWALTTIRGKMPGRPPVEPYLHGRADWQPPETQVAWRQEVEVVSKELYKRYPPDELLEAFPLKPHELLRDQSNRIMDSLQGLARRFPNKPVWLMDENGKVSIHTLGVIADPTAKAASKKVLVSRLENRTLILPPSVGGLSEEGVLDADAPNADDIADDWMDEVNQTRRRRETSGEPRQDGPPGMALVLTLDRLVGGENGETGDDLDASENRYWHWYTRPSDVEDATWASLEPILLSAHSIDVRQEAKKIVEKIELPSPLKEAVIFAAELHDIGKRREVWQLSIGNPDPSLWYAKTGKPEDGKRWKPQNLSPYRHEFGSVLDTLAESSLRMQLDSFEEDLQDLILHLIAAHHGRARPGFPVREVLDWNHSSKDIEALATETVRRFSRLQRKFGRWGLAYLESLVRAADWAASAPHFVRTEMPEAAK